jgi:hypothetical protein
VVSSPRSNRGGKSPRSLRDPVAPSPPVSRPPKQRPAKRTSAAKKMPKKTKAKRNTTVVRLVLSPEKKDQRYYGGSRTLSTGLCGALKRQAGHVPRGRRSQPVAPIPVHVSVATGGPSLSQPPPPPPPQGTSLTYLALYAKLQPRSATGNVVLSALISTEGASAYHNDGGALPHM